MDAGLPIRIKVDIEYAVTNGRGFDRTNNHQLPKKDVYLDEEFREIILRNVALINPMFSHCWPEYDLSVIYGKASHKIH